MPFPLLRLPLIAETPGAARRTGDAFGVEVGGDSLGRDPASVVLKDTPDDAGLGRTDSSLAADGLAIGRKGLRDVIAIRVAAACFAVLHAPAQTPPHLARQILQEQRVHCALEANMKLADLAFGDGQ